MNCPKKKDKDHAWHHHWCWLRNYPPDCNKCEYGKEGLCDYPWRIAEAVYDEAIREATEKTPKA